MIPGLRASSREVFRILANTHYPHLSALLSAADACIQGGLAYPRLLRTRRRDQFSQALPELAVADHLRLLGYQVNDFDSAKGSGRVPDLALKTAFGPVIVEVYALQAWPEYTAYVSTLHDRLKNLDLPFGFTCEISHRGPAGPNVSPFQWMSAFSKLQEVQSALDELSRGAARAVEGRGPRRFLYAFVGGSFETEVLIGNVVPITLRGMPDRTLCSSDPDMGGTAPEAIFESRLRSVRKKLAKGQAAGTGQGGLAVLVVDLTSADLWSELRSPIYQQLFSDAIGREVTDLHGHAAVVFIDQDAWGHPVNMHFSVVDTDVASSKLISALFP